MANKRDAYLCLTAMLRVRETRLLSAEKAQRMLDAPSFEEAAKLLTDCGYPDLAQSTAEEIEAVLAERRDAAFAELSSLAPDPAIVSAFRMKYDYHNVKAILKGEAQGGDPSRLLTRSGRAAPETLLEAYREGRTVDLPNALGKAMEEARGVLARTANPQLADLILDQACFEEMKAAAEEAGCPFLAGYVRLLIDSTNLKSAVRTLRMHKDADFLQRVLLEGGEVPASRIAAAGDREALAALFASGKLAKAAALGAEAAAGGRMTEFERACDNAVNAYLRDAKLVGFGPEVLAAYIAAVEGELTAVRMILTGRLAGISPDTIRERLRDLYA